MEYRLEVFVAQPDTPVSHRHPELPLVKRPVNQVTVAEAHRIFAQNTVLIARRICGAGHRKTFFNECPVGLAPHRLSDLSLYAQPPSGRLENPLLIALLGLEKRITTL